MILSFKFSCPRSIKLPTDMTTATASISDGHSHDLRKIDPNSQRRFFIGSFVAQG